MKFSDIIELAKAGYTPADIKDLLSMTVDDSGTPSYANHPTPEKDTPATEPGTPSGGDGESDDVNNKEETPDDAKDQKIIDLEKKIAEMQKQNTKTDLSDKNNKSDEDKLKEAISKFM